MTAATARLTIGQMCARFRVSRMTLWLWVDAGLLPCPRQDEDDRRHRYWLEAEIDALTADWPRRPPRRGRP